MPGTEAGPLAKPLRGALTLTTRTIGAASGPTTSTASQVTDKGRNHVIRTINGNLAADPEVVQSGSIQITKPRVVGNTGEYQQGKWQAHDTSTAHFVEARFELGQNAADSCAKEAVIVTGREHTTSWKTTATRRCAANGMPLSAGTSLRPRAFEDRNADCYGT